MDPSKNSQNFVEKAHYPDASQLKISIKTHSIPAALILWPYSHWYLIVPFRFEKNESRHIVRGIQVWSASGLNQQHRSSSWRQRPDTRHSLVKNLLEIDLSV